MKHALLCLVAFAPLVSAQDFLHYKFDSTCTDEVINLAAGTAAFVGNGALDYTTTMPYEVGRFGSGLSGGSTTAGTYSLVDSGWSPATQPLMGDLTFAFWAKERTSPGTSLSYICGCTQTGHRLFTNGIANNGLMLRDVVTTGPFGDDLQLLETNADFISLAAADWVHVAVVVDSTAGTAEWFIDGMSVQVDTGVGSGLIDTAGNYVVGRYLATNENNYDLDDWLLSNRAYSSFEILSLSLAPRAGDGDYTSGIASQCGGGSATLASAGGDPFAGNTGYQLEIATAAPSVFLLFAGFDRCTFGGALPLPLDGTPFTPLLNGCWILADAPVVVNGTANGPAVLAPFPLPGTAPLGAALYSQFLALDLATLTASMSNGFATSLGV